MTLITRVTSNSGALIGVTLLIELNDSREFLPHLEKSHRDDMDGALTMSLNMFTLGTAREVMVLYKLMFGAILTKNLVRDLKIEMAGVLPALVGALRLW